MKVNLFKNEIPEDQEFVFFDDKQINVEKAEEYAKIGGYTIKTVADIVAGLEDKKIISPTATEDADLYTQLERDGVFGFIKQIASYTIKNKTEQKEQPAH
jgi:hypothetical protein